MFLKHEPSGGLVEVLDLPTLFNPLRNGVKGRLHSGEEVQDAEEFSKRELLFPSEERLPRCWMDPEYRDTAVA